MRKFPYITTGKILQELKAEDCSITRVTFYKLERDGVFQCRKSKAEWRVFTREEAEDVKTAIKINYGKIGSVEGEVRNMLDPKYKAALK